MDTDKPSIMIGDRMISAERPCYVIAEIGVNHNGDVDCARRLIDASVRAGADAVKFQTFRTSALVVSDAPKAPYQQRQTGDGGQAEMLAALELSREQFALLKAHSEQSGVDFISTAFDRESLDDVLSLQPKCLKWPSGEINNRALLRQAAKSKLPIILSTGMAFLSEVAEAVEFLQAEDAGEIAILQCVSDYPAALGEQNLRCIPMMAQAFHKPAGLSDHTEGPWAAVAARGLGMAILEKHITLDRAMPGPDHRASMEPEAFTDLIKVLREVENAIGDGVKRPTDAELKTKQVARKSLVFSRGLPAGHLLQEDDLTAKRPDGGIAPDMIGAVAGRPLRRAVEADERFSWSDVG